MINKINWNDAIFFFDVDDTLIDTFSNSLVASDVISDVLTKEVDRNTSKLITERFKHFFRLLANGHWSNGSVNVEHEKVMARITELQRPVIELYGSIRKWSREVLLTVAAEDFNCNLSDSLIYDAVDKYWEKLASLSTPKQGVLALFAEIKKHNRPIYLVTGSDARLRRNTEGLFTYDPVESEKFKINRMELLKDNGISFDGVSIGDPEDKPHVDFFQKAINMVQEKSNSQIDNKNIIMFGDSYLADLQTPKEKLFFGLVVLFHEGQDKSIEESERYISTGDLYSSLTYLV